MIRLALSSLWSRRLSVGLTILTLALSVALFLSVERLRQSARDGFDGTVSGIDVLVGARSGDLSLLLYTVFGLGDAAASMTWETFQWIEEDERVDWTVPLSLGDSHRGYRVVATEQAYFDHVKTGREQALEFSAETGQGLGGFGVVLGAQVAKDLGYSLGTSVVVQHGLVSAGQGAHDALPFAVSGILKPTGTPIDFNLFVSLRAFEAIHKGWQGEGGTSASSSFKDAEILGADFDPKIITAALVGLKSKRRVFQFIDDVEDFKPEPLTGVLPGVTLSQLWVLVGTVETALRALSILIIIVALIGLVTLLVATLDVRRREIAIYRALGAGPLIVAGLLMLEAFLIGLFAAGLGLVLSLAGLLVAGPLFSAYLHLDLSGGWLSTSQALVLLVFVGVSTLGGLLPAAFAYRASLQDGMRARF